MSARHAIYSNKFRLYCLPQTAPNLHLPKTAMIPSRFAVVLICLFAFATSSCQTLQQVAALRDVAFLIDRVADARLAGVDLSRIRSFEDLRPTDALRLSAAIADGDLPLDFTLHLSAENPQENSVDARLVQMDWTLLLDERETVSGLFDQNIVLPPGEPRDVPIGIQLDLADFFNDSAQDLVELALAVAGRNGEPKRIKLEAQPTIDTAIGPIRYPRPITIVSRDIGS